MSETDPEAEAQAVQEPEPELASSGPQRDRDETERRLRDELASLRAQASEAQTTHDAALAQLRSESEARVIRAELRAEAVRSGIIDLDALRLVDAGGVKVGDDGEVTGVEAVIKAFKKAKPYLFAKSETPVSMVTTSAPARTPAPAAPTPVDARGLDRQQ